MRLLGVEWEYNWCNSGIAEWCSKYGGTDKGEHCGREMITPPMTLSNISQALVDFGNVLEKGNATADSNCGIHVHVDARDVSNSAMRRLLKVYALVEPILYLCGGQRRIKSEWCRPNGKYCLEALKSHRWKRHYYNNIIFRDYGKYDWYCKNKTSLLKHDGSRYYGLNILPWVAGYERKSNDTTVEFRIHRNTLNAGRVIGFTELCMDLVDWSVKHRKKDVDKLPTNNLEAINIISPNSKGYVYNRMKIWEQVVSEKGRTLEKCDEGIKIRT